METIEETTQTDIEDEVEDKRVVDVVGAFLKKYKYNKKSLIQILLDIQQSYGWLPREMLSEVSRQLNVPYSQIYQIATYLRGNNSSRPTTEPPEPPLETN
jgi:NADH:ubiquinone oxidoreductase subunit E